ncbi:hypothetical protein GOP47_0020670 [Adiantum capillus-veneris]|uniref:Uncharacterized protein n=1 Tax=Adiantum capillus-veneris TaxID=13818 RepID=A0A9D4Z7N7_ADICA|nr:hypothetical protein GOP47_0020670 [Adiantum capillus-veneris]
MVCLSPSTLFRSIVASLHADFASSFLAFFLFFQVVAELSISVFRLEVVERSRQREANGSLVWRPLLTLTETLPVTMASTPRLG